MYPFNVMYSSLHHKSLAPSISFNQFENFVLATRYYVRRILARKNRRYFMLMLILNSIKMFDFIKLIFSTVKDIISLNAFHVSLI